MSTNVARFGKAVTTAMRLPTPASMLRTIMASTDGADNGLRAASYDSRVSGGSSDSHPERIAASRNNWATDDNTPDGPGRRPNTRHELDTMRLIARHANAWHDAIGALMAECANAAPPVDWAESIHDAHMLHELATGIDGQRIPGSSKLQAAADIGRDVHGWTIQACNTITDLAKVHERLVQELTPTKASAWQRYKSAHPDASPGEVCEVHARLTPPIYTPKHRKEPLCKGCGDLTRLGGIKPPPSLIELRERGGQVAYRLARSRWLSECGASLDRTSA